MGDGRECPRKQRLTKPHGIRRLAARVSYLASQASLRSFQISTLISQPVQIIRSLIRPTTEHRLPHQPTLHILALNLLNNKPPPRLLNHRPKPCLTSLPRKPNGNSSTETQSFHHTTHPTAFLAEIRTLSELPHSSNRHLRTFQPRSMDLLSLHLHQPSTLPRL
jgi:hypothetical protein